MNFNSKNGRKKSFSYETKVSIHLSQRGEWICGGQPLKEKRLLCKSMFLPIERWTLILKMVERKVFPLKPKAKFIYPNEENEFLVPNH